MTNKNQLDVKVVVNGKPFDVNANVEAPVLTIIEHALHASGNSGQPVANWELRDAAGNVLEPNRKLEDYSLQNTVTLFLNLRAGIGG